MWRRQDNIARFTEERLTPCAEELAQTVSGLEHLEPGGLPECKKAKDSKGAAKAPSNCIFVDGGRLPY